MKLKVSRCYQIRLYNMPSICYKLNAQRVLLTKNLKAPKIQEIYILLFFLFFFFLA